VRPRPYPPRGDGTADVDLDSVSQVRVDADAPPHVYPVDGVCLVVRELAIEDLRPFDDRQSLADLPKVVHGAVDPQDLNNPSLATFSKVCLSQDRKVQRPAHLSEWCKVGRFPSPLGMNSSRFNRGLSFVADTETILVDIIASSDETTVSREFLRAGPRATLAFHPSNQVKPCVVTCGGLCPGLNNVIRELVITLIKVYAPRSAPSALRPSPPRRWKRPRRASLTVVVAPFPAPPAQLQREGAHQRNPVRAQGLLLHGAQHHSADA
jgi:hypothetical protein